MECNCPHLRLACWEPSLQWSYLQRSWPKDWHHRSNKASREVSCQLRRHQLHTVGHDHRLHVASGCEVDAKTQVDDGDASPHYWWQDKGCESVAGTDLASGRTPHWLGYFLRFVTRNIIAVRIDRFAEEIKEIPDRALVCSAHKETERAADWRVPNSIVNH